MNGKFLQIIFFNQSIDPFPNARFDSIINAEGSECISMQATTTILCPYAHDGYTNGVAMRDRDLYFECPVCLADSPPASNHAEAIKLALKRVHILIQRHAVLILTAYYPLLVLVRMLGSMSAPCATCWCRLGVYIYVTRFTSRMVMVILWM